jgi:hypothetical protein
MRRRTLLGVALSLTLTGCVEDLGGVFLVKNEWDRPIFFGANEIALGSTYKYGIQGCGQPALTLEDKNGKAVVTVEKWCAGQKLTVRGPDDFTLESATAE